MNINFWDNETGRLDELRFNREIDEESERLILAKQAFEKRVALFPIDRVFEQKSELDDIRTATRYFFIEKAKECLIDSCMRHFSQYLDIDEHQEQATYPLQQYLDYSDPSEKTAQQGKKYVETVSFRLVEDIDEDGEAHGDEMIVRFMLPQSFLMAANVGSMEVDNWLATVDEVVVKHISSDKTKPVLPEYIISTEVAYPNVPVTRRLIKRLISRSIKIDEASILQKDFEEAEYLLTILPKLKDMKLYPFKIKDVPTIYK